MYSFNTPVEKDILINLLQTDVREASELFNLNLIFVVLLLGFLPCFCYYYLSKKYNFLNNNFKAVLIAKVINIILSITIISSIIFFNFKSFLIIKSNKELADYLPPYNYIAGTINAIKKYNKIMRITTMGETQKTYINISDDSILNLNTEKENLLIFVIGESERSKSISYNGYDKSTMEFLDKYKDNIINFQNFYSCNTSTFNSIPCMFTHSKKLSLSKMLDHENYIDILKKLDFGLEWRTSNGGCKGVCSAITNIIEKNDDIELLDNFGRIDKNKRNNIIFLHIRGSHGTEYYTRYPQEFEHWKPVCKEKELRKCSDEEIINAYNNSIRYTMFVISKIIETLQNKKNLNTGLIFVSDHGENMGENGFYLHGTPFSLTKEFAGKVASFMWFSDNWYKEFSLDKQCMKNKSTERYEHYNIFHTILGIFKIENKYYDEGMDIFKGCGL
jgi:lipid A ethanolaminephosphotransferase